MRQRSPEDYRVTRRHHRGEYLKGEEVVEPAVPAVFDQIDSAQTADRLALARWLVSEQNPIEVGTSVRITVLATDNVGVEELANQCPRLASPVTTEELSARTLRCGIGVNLTGHAAVLIDGDVAGRDRARCSPLVWRRCGPLGGGSV